MADIKNNHPSVLGRDKPISYSWTDEYAKSNGWDDWEKGKKVPDVVVRGPEPKSVRGPEPTFPVGRGPPRTKKLKRLDTALQKKSRYCQKEMENEHIKNGSDFVRWMSKKFDPKNEKHILLAQEMTSCLWLSHHLTPD